MTEIFNDSEGSASSMNFVWLLSLITIIGTWILLSLKTGTLQHVTGGDALWFTSLFAGKIVQNFYESRTPQPVSDVKAGLIQDGKGNFSSARFIWIVCVLGIIFTWAYLAWKNMEMQHFSTGDAGWFTALFGSKVGTTMVERGGFGDYGDSDTDVYEGMTGYKGMIGSEGELGSSKEKDILIAQLQETIKVQTGFNKNIVKKLNPIKQNDPDSDLDSDPEIIKPVEL